MKVHFAWLFEPLFKQGNDIYIFRSPHGTSLNASLNDYFMGDKLAFIIKPKKK